jgi:hypothetical protein
LPPDGLGFELGLRDDAEREERLLADERRRALVPDPFVLAVDGRGFLFVC